MRIEFERYGLARFRKIVGAFELMGGCGLIVGFTYPSIHLLASGGLGLLMLLGLRARLRVGDPLLSLVPAFLLLIINLAIFLIRF